LNRDGDGDDCNIQVTVEFCAEVVVKVPPFAEAKASSCVTLGGSICDWDELKERAQPMARDTANELAAQLRQQLETLRDLLE
jgi:hypothetical protein